MSVNPFCQLQDPLFPEGALPVLMAGFSAGLPAWSGLQTKFDGSVEASSVKNNATAFAKNSAVAFLFLPPSMPGRPARLLLTRRSMAVRTHKGQIGFAGGRSEASDFGPAETVLREVKEEVGIPSESISVLGVLEPERALDGGLVVPVVAVARVSESELVAAPEEVKAIHLLEWPHFAVLAALRFEFTLFGLRRDSWLFQTDPPVWGLTAKIIAGAGLEVTS